MKELVLALAKRRIGPLAYSDIAATSIALAENDLPMAILTCAFTALAASVEAPDGVGIGVAALVSLLTAVTGGVPAEIEVARLFLPVALSLACALVRGEEEHVSQAHVSSPSPVSSWDERFSARLRERSTLNAERIRRVVPRIRGLSVKSIDKLVLHANGRDVRDLTVDEWLQCPGVGPKLASAIRAELQTDEGVDSTS